MYTAYTQQKHTSVDGTKTAAMPDSDTGGSVTEVGVGQGTFVYTFGAEGDLLCLDADNGKPVWSQKLSGEKNIGIMPEALE